MVRQIIAEAYKHSAEFGLLVELAAVTGARYSQIARLNVADLQADGLEPRLMMPPSRREIRAYEPTASSRRSPANSLTGSGCLPAIGRRPRRY